MDKLVFNIYVCTVVFVFITFALFSSWAFFTGLLAFVMWDSRPLTDLLHWTSFRVSSTFSILLTLWWFFDEGKNMYRKEVPNKDWLKNGKWL